MDTQTLTKAQIACPTQKQTASFGSDSSSVFYAYCDSLQVAYNTLCDNEDNDIVADPVKIECALSTLCADLNALATALKNEPLHAGDMDILYSMKFPVAVLGTDFCDGIDLRYVGFPVDVDAVLNDRDALVCFVKTQVDFCAEENIKMTEKTLANLWPLKVYLNRRSKLNFGIYQSGYNCCSIDVASVVDGKIVM